MIIQLANYRYNTHPAEYELNMVFWRKIHEAFGQLTVVGRAPVSSFEFSMRDGISFALFPRASSQLRFLLALRVWLHSIAVPTLVWCSEPVVSSLVAEPYARRHGIPFFVELQGNFFHGSLGAGIKGLVIRLLARRAARRADMIRVCSPGHARALARIGIPRERISVIGARVDTALFAPMPGGVDERAGGVDERERLGFGLDDVLLVGTGSLLPGKGFGDAIEALATLPGYCKLVLIGDGPLRDRLARQAVRIGVADRVCFLDRVEHSQVAKVLNACDIFVLPSRSEGMPRAVAEAMAVGLPVVASRIDGIMEQVVEGETGLLCRPGSPQDFAHALRFMAENPVSRVRMGQAGRRLALERFEIDSVMRLWRETLGRCLSGAAWRGKEFARIRP